MNDITYAVMVTYNYHKIHLTKLQRSNNLFINQHAAQSGIWEQYKLYKSSYAILNAYFASPKH
jgi:hypothetical protein